MFFERSYLPDWGGDFLAFVVAIFGCAMVLMEIPTSARAAGTLEIHPSEVADTVADGFVIYQNTEIHGNHIRSPQGGFFLEDATIQSCESACLADWNCVAFTYRQDLEECALLSKIEARTNSSVTISGIRKNDTQAMQFTPLSLFPKLERKRGGYFVGLGAISPDGRFILSTAASGDPILNLWELETGKIVRSFEGREYRAESFAITPDGKNVVSGFGGLLTLWSIESDDILRTWGGTSQWDSTEVMITPDGKNIIVRTVFDGGGDLDLFELTTLRHIRSLRGVEIASNIVSDVTITPDGLYAVVTLATADAVVFVSLETGKVSRKFEFEARAVAPTPDGRYIVTSDGHGSIELRNVNSGQLIRQFKSGDDYAWGIGVSPDGRQIAAIVGTYDRPRGLKFWDLETGELDYVLDGIVDSFFYTPDGKRVVTITGGGLTKLWDGPELLATFIHSGDDAWLTYTPEGFFAGSEGAEQVLSVIHGGEEFPIERVAATLNREDLVRAKLAGDPNGQVEEEALKIALGAGRAVEKAPLEESGYQDIVMQLLASTMEDIDYTLTGVKYEPEHKISETDLNGDGQHELVVFLDLGPASCSSGGCWYPAYVLTKIENEWLVVLEEQVADQLFVLEGRSSGWNELYTLHREQLGTIDTFIKIRHFEWHDGRYAVRRSITVDGRGQAGFSSAIPWYDLDIREQPEAQVSPPNPDQSSPDSGKDGDNSAMFELEFWRSIKDSVSVEAFELYLEKYPNGTFADLARLRVKNLSAAEGQRELPCEGLNNGSSEETDLTTNGGIADIDTVQFVAEHVEGTGDAPVTLVVYNNLNCWDFYKGQHEELRKLYVDQGLLRIVHRFVPWTEIARVAIGISACSKEKNFLENITHFMENYSLMKQSENKLEIYLMLSAQIGVDSDEFYECLQNHQLIEDVISVLDHPSGAVDAVPTFIIEFKHPENGVYVYSRFAGNDKFEDVKTEINRYLTEEGIELISSNADDKMPGDMKGIWTSSQSRCTSYVEDISSANYLDEAFLIPFDEQSRLYLITSGRIKLNDDAHTECEFDGIEILGNDIIAGLRCYNVVFSPDINRKALRITRDNGMAIFNWIRDSGDSAERLYKCMSLSSLSVHFGPLWIYDSKNCTATAPHTRADIVFSKDATGNLILIIEDRGTGQIPKEDTTVGVYVDKFAPFVSEASVFPGGFSMSLGPLSSSAEVFSSGLFMSIWTYEMVLRGSGEYKVPILDLPLLGSRQAIDFLEQCQRGRE